MLVPDLYTRGNDRVRNHRLRTVRKERFFNKWYRTFIMHVIMYM